MTKLITNNFKLNLGDQIVESLVEPSNTAFYIFAGEHVARTSNTIPTPDDSVQTVLIDSYRNMIFGKRLASSDVNIMIRRVDYVTDKAFDMYDDTDEAIYTKDFYTISDEGAFYHVYKCLNNNLGANSTVEPQISFVFGANNYVFETADGYKWKYMYSVSDADETYLSTTTFFPVKANTTVEDDAIKGAIDVIAIDGQGRGYHNYLEGIFQSGDVRVGGNSSLYAISNASISQTNGFYTGCLVYLSTGTGAGQYSTINDYFSNGNGNFIVIDSIFAVPPVNGTTYEISPHVSITGSGAETSNAVARALVNATASNNIYKVEMLSVGANYDYAIANVVANAVVSVSSNALVRPVYSPLNGHGANSAAELGAKTIVFTTKFTNSESNTIASNNEYQVVGLLKDPVFANVNIEVKNSTGTYIDDETLFKINPVRVNTNSVINTTSAVIQSETSTLSNAAVTVGGTSGSYIPGEILTVSGGTPIINATVNVTSTEVRTVAINVAGSGYANGDTVEVDDGTGTNAEFTVTTGAADTIPASLVISDRGDYTVNPTLTASATTATLGSGTGLTVDLTMRILTVLVDTPGAYALIPADYATNNPTGGSGSGLELSLTFTTTGLGDFVNQFVVGDYIYIINQEDTEHQLAVVNSITNATYMDITVNGYFACSQALIYQANLSSNAVVQTVANATNILVDDLNGLFATDDHIIGFGSGAKSQVNSIFRNDVSKGFNTFNQLYKYNVTILSGTFIEDEKIYQGASLATSTANATVHSVVNIGGDDLIFTSNQVGVFVTGTNLVGATGGATASIINKYSPEVVFGSGQVLFLENIEPVTRDDAQSEQFKIFFDF